MVQPAKDLQLMLFEVVSSAKGCATHNVEKYVDKEHRSEKNEKYVQTKETDNLRTKKGSPVTVLE